jgi:hypothetical protein
METPWQNIQSFSGASAVGAVVFVDLALVADAFADNLFPTINLYAQTPTWAIVVAIPILSLVYLIGVLAIGVGEALLGWLRLGKGVTPDEDTTALVRCSDALIGRYQRLRQEAELLAGSVVAFGLLGVGSTLHAWRIVGWRRFLFAVAIAAMIFAAASLALAVRRYATAYRIATTARPSNSLRVPLQTEPK